MPDPTGSEVLSSAPSFAQAERAVTSRRTAMSVADMDNIFSYHAPTEEQRIAYDMIRGAAKGFASIVLEYAPVCADQTHAIRLIRDAMMWANAAVALKGSV